VPCGRRSRDRGDLIIHLTNFLTLPGALIL
jgi:hypothetical protein